jgi:superfamily II DNA/RNA helicase
MPLKLKDFLYQVGRCGRFGTPATSITFVTPDDTDMLESVEKYYGIQIPELPSL